MDYLEHCLFHLVVFSFFPDYVEVTDGRVAVCRDAVRGKCSRPMCKYYHIPVTLPPSKWWGLNLGTQYHTPCNGSLLRSNTQKKQHNTKCIYFDFSSRDSIGFETTYIYTVSQCRRRGKTWLERESWTFLLSIRISPDAIWPVVLTHIMLTSSSKYWRPRHVFFFFLFKRKEIWLSRSYSTHIKCLNCIKEYISLLNFFSWYARTNLSTRRSYQILLLRIFYSNFFFFQWWITKSHMWYITFSLFVFVLRKL